MEKILTKNIETPNSHEIDVYLKSGGYRALKKALSMKSADIIAEVEKAKLVGRGGAGFPTGLKWKFVAGEKAEKKYLVCNADEGEPGTFKDRVLLGKNPHLLIEGMIISAYAMGAQKSYLYIRGEYFQEIKILQKAIKDAKAKGILGEKILGSNFSHEMVLFVGAGAYVCGEETSLFESVEGNRACPREKPPFPTQVGVMQGPTAINNVETLSNVPFIVENGGEAFSKIGNPDNPGPKLFCISGHVNKPGVYETTMEITLGELIKLAGGVKGTFKACQPGGASSQFLTDLGVKLNYKSVADAGSMLGSGAVIVCNDTVSMVDAAVNVIDFFAHESCGYCNPCQMGSTKAKQMMHLFQDGKGKREYLKLFEDIFGMQKNLCRCGLGQVALCAVTSAAKLFPQEFEEKLMK
ncbi:MAG: SLBB domain-containing protein [Planctomycetes bacterium]|nr:SLBB domain-containing protein [Planctomycetota bacterium]